MGALDKLPAEIVDNIVARLEHSRDVLNLSLTNRALSKWTSQLLFPGVETQGWKQFLKGRFGLDVTKQLPADARTVHGLTTLHRNWDRKAFVATFLAPAQVEITSVINWKPRGSVAGQAQTMGYRPSIDSYEVINGRWDSRKEVVAWSAGPELVIRSKKTRPHPSGILEEEYGARDTTKWMSFLVPGAIEGLDDITTLKMLRPHQKPPSLEGVAFGNAFNTLGMLLINSDEKRSRVRRYRTHHDRPVNHLDISSASDPFMAAILGRSVLALYKVDVDEEKSDSVGSVSQVVPETNSTSLSQLWSSNFISSDRVAVGLGPSYVPIHVYKITPTGFAEKPERTFSLNKNYSAGDLRILGNYNRSVNPIIPLPAGSFTESPNGNLFLSGGHDGIVRLHDMRSPHDFETMYWDPTNDSSIYSLATHGLERVIVGTSMHSMLKVFDLRVAGAHSYHSIRPQTSTPPQQRTRNGDYATNDIVRQAVAQSDESTAVTGGWNLYMSPRNKPRNIISPYIRHPLPSSYDCPIYSLSVPSPFSSNVYAGLEGAVMNLTFLSVLDKHPDPLLMNTIKYMPNKHEINYRKSYDLSGGAFNCGMYEQGDEQALGMQLMRERKRKRKRSRSRKGRGRER
ncbi:hypothetical protein B0J11DRAFT_547455 [Dendryphion nanum]|uniref:F-box domain-containing protein n=1 Tax=Dendryphion nanum TaxID=256645 RepID=A0A9P9ECV9_9PLEO|nr:hypothetical protein B0J11DRAFT_547455 [Dendryphion nanum]